MAGIRAATAGTNGCKNPLTDTCCKPTLEMRVISFERAPCPNVNDGAALYTLLMNGKPGAAEISSIILSAEAGDPL
jgi:hypothetical protein